MIFVFFGARFFFFKVIFELKDLNPPVLRGINKSEGGEGALVEGRVWFEVVWFWKCGLEERGELRPCLPRRLMTRNKRS